MNFIGDPIIAPADGKFSKTEVKRFEEYHKKKIKIMSSGPSRQVLLDYINDMRVFIKRYVWSGWKGPDGMRLNITKTKSDTGKAWHICDGRKVPPKGVYGFYCPWDFSASFAAGKPLDKAIEVYDHEEGHHQNCINAEDVGEFPSEYNMRWKAFLRIAMDVDVGNMFLDYVFWGRPLWGDFKNIKEMNIYRAASLMFFFVANHFKGNLTKGAKFVFGSGAKKLRKFFYKKFNSYKGKFNANEIWMKEVDNLIGSKGLNDYLTEIRRKYTKNNDIQLKFKKVKKTK